MPLITANKIHNGHGWLPPGTVIEVADNGSILSLRQGGDDSVVFYDGVLTPGFVNAHCHLELCHMKGRVPEHTGLIPFLKHIPLHRNDCTDAQKEVARQAGYHELLRNGVVAVGDIANTTDTLDVRSMGGMHFFTFVESLGFNEANAARSFGYALGTYSSFAAQQGNGMVLQQGIVPHAPYSVSAALFGLIGGHGSDGVVISVHNQESREEDSYYKTKEGGVRDLLQTLGIDDTSFKPTGQSSLQSYLPWMPAQLRFLFVHNTYTSRQDVQYAHSRLKDVYWCLCPNANLYIENTLPEIPMFLSEGASICIGTDSLASNHQLSILSEILTIKRHYAAISWETLLTWATRNGAEALQMQQSIGTIVPGKTPGILQITGLDEDAPIVTRII